MELVYNASLTRSLQSAACDHCKTARTKCDRHEPCETCTRRGRACTYNVLKASKDLKRKRNLSIEGPSAVEVLSPTAPWPINQDLDGTANPLTSSPAVTRQDQHVIALLAEQTDLLHWPEDSTFDVFDYDNVWAPEYSLDELMPDYLHFGHRASDGGTPETHINVALVEKLLDLYVKQIHPSIPLCRPSMIYDGLQNKDLARDRHFGALISAICAFISLQAPQPHQSRDRGKDFLKEATRLFADDHLGENPTTETALASLLIFGALWSLGSENAAWLRLQETLNLVKLLELEKTAGHLLPSVSILQWLDEMYLLWGLFVVERVFAAGRQHDLRMTYPTPYSLDSFWTAHENLEVQEKRHSAALILLVQSFGRLDNGIMLCWRKKCNKGLGFGRCQSLDQRKVVAMLSSFPNENSIQWQTLLVPSHNIRCVSQEPVSQQNDGGDVLLTSLWLQNRVWHLALTHGLLTVGAVQSFLRYDYAIQLADRTIEVLKAMRMSGFEGHGQGLADKCYSIASDFIDIAEWLATHMEEEPADFEGEEPVYNRGTSLNSTTNESTSQQRQPNGSPIAINLADNPASEHKRSTTEIATSFLGFFALFNNGNNGKFKQYMDRYQRFMVSKGGKHHTV